MASGQLYAGNILSGSFGSRSPGAIVGELFNTNPSGLAAELISPGYLTTGDLDFGGEGEVSGLSEFAVEIWFQPRTSVAPAGGDTIAYGPMTTTGTATKEWQLTLNAGSTFTFSARNSTPSTVSVTSTTLAQLSNWYHLVGAVSGGNLRLYVNGVQEASTVWSGTVQTRGTTAGSMDTAVGDSGGTDTYDYDEFAIYRYGLGADRILAHYQAGRQRGFASGMIPGQRCIAALDLITSRAPRRINTGTRLMQSEYMTGQSALDELQLARQAENVDATTFISKSGEVVFLDAAHRSSAPYNTVQMILDDDGSDTPYEDYSTDYSEDTLANEWNVTRTNGVTQTVSDATSISIYFRQPQSIDGLPLTLDSDALNIANGMLAKYKDPILRGTSVSLNTNDLTTAEQVFRRDLADKVRMQRTPPGGGSRLDQNLFIQQIQISGSENEPWDVTWGLSPL